MSTYIKSCSIFMFVTFMSTIQSHTILFITFFPWPSNFLHSTYVCVILTHFFLQFIHCSYPVQCAYIPSCYTPFPLPRSITLSLFWVHNVGFITVFYCDWLLACHPTPNLDGQSTTFITPGAGWPSYTPRYWVPILVAFYVLHGLQWGCSLPQSPHRDSWRVTS